MKLTEAEMRMVFQIESTNQNAALNEGSVKYFSQNGLQGLA